MRITCFFVPFAFFLALLQCPAVFRRTMWQVDCTVCNYFGTDSELAPISVGGSRIRSNKRLAIDPSNFNY